MDWTSGLSTDAFSFDATVVVDHAAGQNTYRFSYKESQNTVPTNFAK